MIWNSAPWRDELCKSATKLEQVIVRRKPSEKLIIELEKAVFFAAYIIRKLMEAKKLSSGYNPIDVRSYPAKEKLVTLLNWHHLDDLYDFSSPRNETMGLKDFCNQIIHSYVFMPFSSSKTGPVKTIVFTSDRERSNALHEVSLVALSDILRIVAKDYPSQSTWKFNNKTGDYQVWNSTPTR